MRATIPALILLTLLPSLPLQAAEPETPATLESLQAEVERLRGIMPGQAFAMTQVAYNFNNLWFAVQAENWPLAQFYLNETRVRLRWAIRITPVRRLANGEIDLTPIATALETNQLAAVEESITAHDNAGFVASYSAMMHGCQGCHEAAEKPFLQLQIPTTPAEAMIRFTP
ncbi:MAG: hypothetical protein ACO1PZ_12475 [Gammaproteobacteria bacterium]